MKNILFISHHLNRAGTEAFMMNVFRGIDHQRFHVDFLVYNQKETEYSREVESAGCKVWRVPSRRESPWGWYRSLNRFFREHAGEYVAIHYCGNGLTAIAPIVFAYIYGVPIRIAHSHSSSSSGLHNHLLHFLQRGVVRRLTTHHFACSSSAAKWFFGNAPVVVIKNGIDTSRFAYNPQVREKVRAEAGILPTTTVIGHVGRFSEEKNHVFLLKVFAEYLRIQPDALLMLVGVGPLMDVVRQQAGALQIMDKVAFLGERHDVNELVQAFDIFILPSTFEGLPFVLIEAQCAGLPCLVSDAVSSDNCLTDHFEILSLKQSPVKWAHKITSMLGSFQRKDGRKTIEEQGYSAASTIKYLENIYDAKI